MPELSNLATTIKTCQKCPLHKGRTHAVPGEGSLDAIIMFIGEAPGRQEDQQGRPFVGKAGSLFNMALAKANLDRQDLFITNVVKCRPPKNRNPREEEIAACHPYLSRQVTLINPHILCAMGRVAAEHLLPQYGVEPSSMSRMHGHAFQLTGSPRYIVPLYHPAASIYNPSLTDVFIADICKITKLINR